jgi:hypothetical protein
LARRIEAAIAATRLHHKPAVQCDPLYVGIVVIVCRFPRTSMVVAAALAITSALWKRCHAETLRASSDRRFDLTQSKPRSKLNSGQPSCVQN